ncbi:hypothetical protein FRC06_010651 [Ceratobasidium sp. 370]|nr:hypothetical protein FRC06_010651 [Ceratobasidium sp. 370]
MSRKPASGKDASSFVQAPGTIIRSTVSRAWRTSKPPLPGISEVGEVMKSLIGSMKTQGYDNEQLTLLMERVEGLLSIAEDFDDSRHPELADMARQLNGAKETFETESKRQWQSGILGAEQRQIMLDHITCKIDGIMEATSLRIQLRRAEARPNPIDNFLVVGAYEITGQTVLYKGTHRCESALQRVARFGRLGDSECGSPTTSITRRGWLGKVPVTYKTYSSRSGDAATKVAEEELKYLSRCLHPNVATVIGVTKGYSGPNGYVVTAGGMLIRQFASNVDSGATFVKCIRGILEVVDLDLMNALGVTCTRPWMHNFHVTVQPDGHPIVFPILDNEEDTSNSVDLYRNLIFEAFDTPTNPAAQLAADACSGSYRVRSISQVHKFLDSLAALDWKTFTPLEVARLAAACEMAPAESLHALDGYSGSMFPFFLNDRGIEYGGDCDSLGIQWDPAEGQCAPTIMMHRADGNGNSITKMPRVNAAEGAQWVSVPLVNSQWNGVYWGYLDRNPIFYKQASQARMALRKRGLKPNDVSYCHRMAYQLIFESTGGVSESLYLHRNLSSWSDPHGFWDFLSTSADPRSDTARLKRKDQVVDYTIIAKIIRLTDMWDYKYKQMMKLSLASVPGSYPSSRAEDSTDNEDG